MTEFDSQHHDFSQYLPSMASSDASGTFLKLPPDVALSRFQRHVAKRGLQGAVHFLSNARGKITGAVWKE